MTRLFKVGFGLSVASVLIGLLAGMLIGGFWKDHIISFGCILGACIFIGTVALDFGSGQDDR